MSLLPLIDSQPTELYVQGAQLFYDGFAIRIDWRVTRQDPRDVTKNIGQVSVARLAMSPNLALALLEDLKSVASALQKHQKGQN